MKYLEQLYWKIIIIYLKFKLNWYGLFLFVKSVILTWSSYLWSSVNPCLQVISITYTCHSFQPRFNSLPLIVALQKQKHTWKHWSSLLGSHLEHLGSSTLPGAEETLPMCSSRAHGGSLASAWSPFLGSPGPPWQHFSVSTLSSSLKHITMNTEHWSEEVWNINTWKAKLSPNLA